MKIRKQLSITLIIFISILLIIYIISKIEFNSISYNLNQLPQQIKNQHQLHSFEIFAEKIKNNYQVCANNVLAHVYSTEVSWKQDYFMCAEDTWYEINNFNSWNNQREKFKMISLWRNLDKQLQYAINLYELNQSDKAIEILKKDNISLYFKKIDAFLEQVKYSKYDNTIASYMDTFSVNQFIILDIKKHMKNISTASDYTYIFLICCCVGVFYLTYNSITKSLNSLFKIIVSIHKGNLQVKIPQQLLNASNEFTLVAASIKEMANNLKSSMFSVKSLEDEVISHLKTTESLQKATEDAKASNKAKSMFLSNMSHEIRTPLNAITGNAEILSILAKDHQLEQQEIDRRLEIIIKSSDHLLDLINDILDLSKIEADEISLEILDFNLADLLNYMKDSFETTADDKNINFVVDLIGMYDNDFSGDITKLKQILINLLGNAMKFTPEGGVVKLRADYNEINKILTFVVTDTGVGISPDKINSIFKVFSQEDESITRKFGGTGLGLAISKNLCLAMGGDLICSSIPGKGSSFTATIKCNYSTKRIEQQVYQDKQKNIKLKLSKLNILVAEDAPYNQEIIKWHLEYFKTTYKIVANGQEVLDALQSQDYDLILMDIQMPVLSGEDAVKIIRKQGNNVPIVALTANVMQEQIDHYLSIGFTDFLSKPFKAKQFLQVILDNTSVTP